MWKHSSEHGVEVEDVRLCLSALLAPKAELRISGPLPFGAHDRAVSTPSGGTRDTSPSPPKTGSWLRRRSGRPGVGEEGSVSVSAQSHFSIQETDLGDFEDTVLAIAYALVMVNSANHNATLKKDKATQISRNVFKQMITAASKFNISDGLMSFLYASISAAPLQATDSSSAHVSDELSITTLTYTHVCRGYSIMYAWTRDYELILFSVPRHCSLSHFAVERIAKLGGELGGPRPT